jgi:hypothetical protein
MNWKTNTDDATHDARWAMVNDPHVVVVHRPCKRTKTGGVHKGSRDAIIRQAREEHPEYGNAAMVEIWYGTENSTNTVLRFKPDEPAIYGL